MNAIKLTIAQLFLLVFFSNQTILAGKSALELLSEHSKLRAQFEEHYPEKRFPREGLNGQAQTLNQNILTSNAIWYEFSQINPAKQSKKDLTFYKSFQADVEKIVAQLILEKVADYRGEPTEISLTQRLLEKLSAIKI